MKLIDYIQGKRKGKDAHRIEQDAMNDPFLADAIEGYDALPGNHAKRIARMQSAIRTRSIQRKTSGAWKITAAAVAAIVLVSGYFTLMTHRSNMLAANNSDIYINLYVPEDYLERKRLELSDIRENNPQQDLPITAVANISNLHEVITPIDPINIYLPGNYAQLKADEQKELEELKKHNRKETRQEELIDLPVSSDVPMLAEYVQSESEVGSTKVSSQEAQHRNKKVALDEAISERISGAAIAQAPSMSQSRASKVTAKPTPKTPSVLSGKIVDSNNEPIIGASVVLKGTNTGTITDIDGNYKLQVETENPTLTAYYLGYESIDIPNPENAKIVAMKEDTRTLNEAVVIGYGVQKRSSITGAVSSGKIQKQKTIKPEPLIGKKEYDKYLKQNMVRPNDSDCKNKKGKVILQFSVDESGKPTNIIVKKGLCPAFDNEMIRLVENGPAWSSGTTKAEIEVNF